MIVPLLLFYLAAMVSGVSESGTTLGPNKGSSTTKTRYEKKFIDQESRILYVWFCTDNVHVTI